MICARCRGYFTPTWEAVQELTLSLLGIDYVLRAGVTVIGGASAL